MKIQNTAIATIGLSLFLTACGGGSKKTSESEKAEKEKQDHSFNPDETKLKWISYKHNAKNPVPGTFDKYKIKPGKDTAKDPLDLVSGAKFGVSTSEVNTKDTARDRKIVEHFFGNMKEPSSKISGSVTSIKGTGDMSIELELNGKRKSVTGEYEMKGNKFTYMATIDVKDWGADKSVKALQKACEAKHTGQDGKTKLWSEVKIIMKATFDKDCE
ncbi:MAG: YceI family protein [Flavobacteriales bacterium]